MAGVLKYVPRTAIFVAGVAAGVLSRARREPSPGDPAAIRDLKRSVTELEARMAAQETAQDSRFQKIEARLEEHGSKLAEIPSTTQIVAAMEQLLSKTMSSLDDRLSNQARSIEVLKTTVSQTDSLLERVLESLDSLQSYPETAELERPAV